MKTQTQQTVFPSERFSDTSFMNALLQNKS